MVKGKGYLADLDAVLQTRAAESVGAMNDIAARLSQAV
jgi:hypothetical protein